MNKLPELIIGTNLQNAAGQENELARISSEHRNRGILISGQPGGGKSHLLGSMILQDIKKNIGGIFIDPHNTSQKILPLIPEEFRKNIVVVSFHHDEIPLWPVLDTVTDKDEQQIISDLLIDSWQAQYGKESVGPRAKSMLRNALGLFPVGAGLTPLELLTAFTNAFYRRTLLDQCDKNSTDFDLKEFWENVVISGISEQRFQDWAQPVHNKLQTLLRFSWLRYSMCGVPKKHGNAKGKPLDVKELYNKNSQDPIKKVVYLRDGLLAVATKTDLEIVAEAERNDRIIPSPYGHYIEFNHELDQFLIKTVSGKTISSGFYPYGTLAVSNIKESDEEVLSADITEDELQTYGSRIALYSDSRRKRRAFNRWVEYYANSNDIEAKEVLDIGAMIDDGKFIFFEVPQLQGQDLTQNVATFAIISALLRGYRQLGLPENRIIPSSVYIDEAELFLNAGIENILREMRKAEVSITLSLQRVGQMGNFNDPLRNGILNTIGTVISFMIGREESKEMTSLMHLNESEDEPYNFGRGYAYFSTMQEDYSLGATQKIQTAPLEENETGKAMNEIRQYSKNHYCQEKEAAHKIYVSRIAAIEKAVGDYTSTAHQAIGGNTSPNKKGGKKP